MTSKRVAYVFFRLVLAALFSAAAGAAAAAAAAHAQQPDPVVMAADGGNGEINLKLKGVDGKVYDVGQTRGEVVLVSFGATWCAPCVWELAAIEELKEEFTGKPVKFWWVSIETEKEASDALLRHYARTHRLTIPVLRDPTRTAFAQFSNRVRIPLVVFFDRHGRFVAPAHRGMSREPIEYKNSMRRRIEMLLAAPSPHEGVPGASSKTK